MANFRDGYEIRGRAIVSRAANNDGARFEGLCLSGLCNVNKLWIVQQFDKANIVVYERVILFPFLVVLYLTREGRVEKLLVYFGRWLAVCILFVLL